MEAGLECLSGICHLIVKHFSRTDVVNGLCEEDREMKLFKLSPFYHYYEMYVPSDPIDDDRYKQIQLGGSWCFCGSGLGWIIGREES